MMPAAAARLSPIQLALEPDFRLGEMAVRPSGLEVVVEGERRTLEPRVMEVLVALARLAGEVVSRDELVAACWNGRSVSDDAINRTIVKVRRIARLAASPSFAVETIPRVGYRLVVSSLPPGLSKPPAGRRHSRAFLLGVVVAGLCLLVVVGTGIVLQSRAASALSKPSIAVAALPAVGGRQAVDFARDLRDDIAGVLTQSGVQTVASMATGGPWRRTPEFALKGSVTRHDGRLTVRVFLEDTRAGLTLWSGHFDRPVTAAQRLSDEVAVAVTETVYTALEPTQQAGAVMDPDSLALYIRGSELIRSPQPLREAEPREALERVVDRAPKLAVGHAVLAIALANDARRAAPEARPALFQAVEQVARRAIAIDPATSGAAYDALYMVRRTRAPSRIAEAEDVLLAGLRAAPDHPFLKMRECRLLTEVGRAAEAAPFCQRALALRPLAAPIGYSYALALNAAGQTELADRAIELAARRHPDHSSTRAAALDLALFGDTPAKARRLLQNPATRPANIGPQAVAALEVYIAAAQSRRPADIDTAVRLIRSATAAGALDIATAVRAAAKLGRLDDAFGLLAERGVDTIRSGDSAMFLMEPATAPMRTDPRFWTAAARIGLARYWVVRNRWPDFCGREVSLSVCKVQTQAALRASPA